MATVYLALGSNVGDSKAHIEKAVQLLSKHLTDIVRAPIYSSKAVGYTEQANFLNTALRAQSTLSVKELLRFLKEVEQQVGRVERFRWGPREIDIDIIFYDAVVIDSSDLTIPHPQFRERDFVLQPLSDINPDLVDPLSKLTVTEVLAKLSASETSILREITD